MRFLLCVLAGVFLMPFAAHAQLSANFYNGGAVRLGYTAEACTSANRGTVRYSSAAKAIDICNGTAWVAAAFNNTSLMRSPDDIGYFVLTQTRWTGDLGGDAGANSKCLTELTTNTNWNGYSDAQSRGILVASKVRAFLCTSLSNCNMVLPYGTYAFATVGSPASGGATFTANADGAGPNDSANWAGYNYFATGSYYWAGRVSNGGYSATTWPSYAGNIYTICTGYTTADGALNGGVGNTNSTGARRYYSSPSNTLSCASKQPLICIVDP